MVTQPRISIDGKNEGQSPQDVLSAINFNSGKYSSKDSASKNTNQIDDLIGALENAYENKRARQVVQWESMRQPSFPLSV